MPITSLNNLRKLSNLSQADDLPLILHGPIQADITLICYGQISPDVIDAAQFLDSQYQSVVVNVVQIQQFDPLPQQLLKDIILSMRYILLIESDVGVDLYKKIEEQLGLKLHHHHYFNPSQAQLVAKIVSLVKSSFLIENKS